VPVTLDYRPFRLITPLDAACLNMLVGDMMSPVGRAEKAAEAEGLTPIDMKAYAPW